MSAEYAVNIEYTEAVCGDSAIIMIDGQPVPISAVLTALNENARLRAGVQAVIEGLPGRCELQFMDSKNCLHCIEWHLSKMLEGGS